MRKIEQAMINAVTAKRNWTGGNTSVTFSDSQTLGIGRVSLHGNDIAIIMQSGEVRPIEKTFRQYPTATTRSRLRALGIDASIKNFNPQINGQDI